MPGYPVLPPSPTYISLYTASPWCSACPIYYRLSYCSISVTITNTWHYSVYRIFFTTASQCCNTVSSSLLPPAALVLVCYSTASQYFSTGVSFTTESHYCSTRVSFCTVSPYLVPVSPSGPPPLLQYPCLIPYIPAALVAAVGYLMSPSLPLPVL
jgi:hypothetical protein